MRVHGGGRPGTIWYMSDTTDVGPAVPPLDALLLVDPPGAAALASSVLSGLAGRDPRDIALLVSTLEAWFDAAGSCSRAAGALHCHRNTVLNRLTRVAVLTGRNVNDPRDAAELYAALRARRLRVTGRERGVGRDVTALRRVSRRTVDP